MNANLSVIIATFNSGKTLKETLDSLIGQTYKNFEVIVVDGLSKDNTVSIIKEYEQKFNSANIAYQWSSEKDSGIYDAWNKALTKVNTSWIAFLGSDDTYYPNALELYDSEISKHPDINYISSRIEYIDENQKVLKIVGKPYDYNQMNRYMNVAHVGSFHHMDLFERHGNYDTNYRIVADYDFFMKCGKDIKAAFFESITARMLNSGISNNNVGIVFKEVLQIQLKYKKTSKLRSYFEYYYSFLRIYKSRLVGKSG